MRKLLLFLFFSFTLYANEQMAEANKHFEQKEYAQAHALYLQNAESEKNSKAAYRLGWMYEKGNGVSKNGDEAIVWYKKASEWDAVDSDREHAIETYYRSFDAIEDSASTETIMQYASGSFALRAYHTNYVVISQMDKVPQGDAFLKDNTYIKTEAKFQLSLRGDYATEWFGGSQLWTAAYSQRSYWQIFVTSEPFRETNYMPEAFVTIPFYHKLDTVAIKGMSLGFIHQSNGQVEYQDKNDTLNDPSRSWNRLYVKSYFQWDRLFANLTLWYPVLSDATLNDNYDIVDYYGYGLLELNYTYGKLLSRFNGRYNVSTNKGAAELEFTYPIGSSKKIFYYLQGFSGYGQSLIDYHNYVNQVGFGISLSR